VKGKNLPNFTKGKGASPLQSIGGKSAKSGGKRFPPFEEPYLKWPLSLLRRKIQKGREKGSHVGDPSFPPPLGEGGKDRRSRGGCTPGPLTTKSFEKRKTDGEERTLPSVQPCRIEKRARRENDYWQAAQKAAGYREEQFF